MPRRDEAEREASLGADVLRALLDQLPEGITIVAADGRIVEVNEAATMLLDDAKPDDVRGRFHERSADVEVRDAAGRLLTPEQWPLTRALHGEHVERFEMATTNRRTGETRLHEVDAGPVLDARGRVAFAISLRRDITRERTEREELERLNALERVAKQMVERANERLVQLNRLAMELARVLTTETVATAAVRLAREAADATVVALVRLAADGRSLDTVATEGIPAPVVDAWRRFPIDAPAPIAESVREDEPVFVSSPIERRARYLRIDDRTSSTVSRSWACFPLHQTGLVTGAIGFGFAEVRTFPDADAAFLSAIAEQVSASLERATLLEDSERARREAEDAARRVRRLEFVTDAAISDLPFDELLDELLERVRTALEADSSTLLLIEGDALHVRGSRGVPRDGVEPPVPVGDGVAGRIFASARPMVVEDLAASHTRPGWLRDRMRSLAGVPLRVQKELVGVLHVATLERRSFTDQDLQLLELVGARVASALERAALYGAR
jgi:PAS domain S-box-containing protein